MIARWMDHLEPSTAQALCVVVATFVPSLGVMTALMLAGPKGPGHLLGSVALGLSLWSVLLFGAALLRRP